MKEPAEKKNHAQYVIGYALGLFVPGLGHLFLYADWRRAAYWFGCSIGAIFLGKYLNPHLEFMTYDRVLALPISLISLLDLWQQYQGALTRGRKILFIALFFVLPGLFFGMLSATRQANPGELIFMMALTWLFVVVYLVRPKKR